MSDLATEVRRRADHRCEHFIFRGVKSKLGKVEMAGLTPIGRATVRVLELNEEFQQALRHEIYRAAL